MLADNALWTMGHAVGKGYKVRLLWPTSETGLTLSQNSFYVNSIDELHWSSHHKYGLIAVPSFIFFYNFFYVFYVYCKMVTYNFLIQCVWWMCCQKRLGRWKNMEWWLFSNKGNYMPWLPLQWASYRPLPCKADSHTGCLGPIAYISQ